LGRRDHQRSLGTAALQRVSEATSAIIPNRGIVQDQEQDAGRWLGAPEGDEDLAVHQIVEASQRCQERDKNTSAQAIASRGTMLQNAC
jgi:hypothetical protein